jgi:hypothetical protein
MGLQTHECTFVRGGFTGCGKTRNGGRRGIYPPRKACKIITGFSPGRLLFLKFRHLHSRCIQGLESPCSLRLRKTIPGSKRPKRSI